MSIFLKKALVFYVAFLFVFVLAWEAENFFQKNNPPLKVYFLDVGQGDAILINYLESIQVLIDGGGDGKKLLNELGNFIPLGDNTLEVVIATHPDKDHIGGLLAAFKKYEVGIFLENSQKSSSNVYQELDKIISEKEIKRENIFEGSKIMLGNIVEMQVFSPDTNYQSQEKSDERNEDSVVFRMDFGENSFLFTGDIGFEKEKDFFMDEEDVDVDFLKVAHHGSKNSSSRDFLKKVSPLVAIISVGKDNRYGHPAKETIARLEEAGARIFRTDQNGTVEVFCRSPHQECQIDF